jgi:hypothetical protein
MGESGLNSCGSIYGQVADFCEKYNGTSGFVNYGEIPD